MKILVKNVDVVTCDEKNSVVKNGYVGIKDGYIDFIKNTEVVEFVPDRVIDGKNKILMPGLINGHTHSGMTLLRNFANDLNLEDWLFNNIFIAEGKMTPEDVYWGTMLGILEMIRSGTTAFAEMYLYMERVAQAVLETGIRCNLCRSPLKFMEGKSTREKINCFDYYKEWNNRDNGRIKVFVEVHSVYLFDRETLSESAYIAKELNTGIHIHLHETLNELKTSMEKYNMSPLEICNETKILDVPVLGAHCVHLSPGDKELLRAKGVSVCHNPTSNLKLGSGVADIPGILKNGINVCIGTDGAASNNNLNMFEEMHIGSILHKGIHKDPTIINANQMLKMATVNGAKAIGFEGEVGVIKEGMKGDVILIDTDKAHLCPVNDPVAAIVYAAQGSDVDTVIVDGRILMEKKEMTTIDEEKVKYMARKISERILG